MTAAHGWAKEQPHATLPAHLSHAAEQCPGSAAQGGTSHSCAMSAAPPAAPSSCPVTLCPSTSPPTCSSPGECRRSSSRREGAHRGGGQVVSLLICGLVLGTTTSKELQDEDDSCSSIYQSWRHLEKRRAGEAQDSDQDLPGPYLCPWHTLPNQFLTRVCADGGTCTGRGDTCHP